IQKPGATVHWAGDEVVAVAAVSEGIAEEAVRAIKVQYEPMPYLVSDAEAPAGAGTEAGPMSQEDIWDMQGDIPDAQLAQTIEKRGVSFEQGEAKLGEMKKFGMPEVILEAIRKARYTPLAEGQPSSPYQKAAAITQGDPDKTFSEAEVVSEGLYGIPVITHCCLEAHGSTSEWPDANNLLMHVSTQNVTGIAGQLAEPL